MICEKCKATLPDGSKFCTECGARLDGPPAEQPASPQAKKPEPTQTVSQPGAQPNPEVQPQNQNPQNVNQPPYAGQYAQRPAAQPQYGGAQPNGPQPHYGQPNGQYGQQYGQPANGQYGQLNGQYNQQYNQQYGQRPQYAGQQYGGGQYNGQSAPQNPPYQHASAPGAPAAAAPLSVLSYIGMIILFAIPIVGLIMMFVWGFGSDVNPNRKNYALAMLILLIVGIVLSIVLSIAFGAVIAALFSDFGDWTSYAAYLS